MLHNNSYRTPLEKKSFADVPLNKCSKKFRQFDRKTSVLESVFNKVADLQAFKFVKKRLQHSSYLVKFAKILRALLFTEHLFTVTASVCSENLGKILVRNN